MRQHVLKVIVVDDGSTDRTREIAKLAGAEVMVHPSNQGKGVALKTGFHAARDSDIIVTLDSDGQHDPHEIPRLIEPLINKEADVVNGSRYLNGNGKETPTYRRVGQNVLDAVTNISNRDLNITDSQSGFRAFAGHTIPIFRFHSTDYTIESEMLIDASKAGLRIKEVGINVTYGEENHHKKNPVSHGMGVLVRLLHDMEFNRPLYYFSIPGVVMIIIGMILGLKFFGDYLGGGSNTLLPTTLAALVAIFGTFITFTGLILHSMSRMIWRVMGK